MHQRSNSDKTLSYVRNLEGGKHGILFHRCPHEKHEALFNFLQAGFQKGEGGIYVASQETSKQLRRHMEDFGLNVKSLERDSVLKIVDYYDWYIIDGEVNVSHIIESGMRMFDEAAEIGLRGMRGCGEVACFFEHGKEKELVEYELMIGRELNFPVTALCAYDVNHVNSLEEKLFFSLIKAHGPVVTSSFARKVEFEDFFPTIIEEVFETVFGEMGKKILLRTLHERFSLSSYKIAENPKAFIEGLGQIIGSGAQVVTKLLVKQMHSKMGIGKTAQFSSI